MNLKAAMVGAMQAHIAGNPPRVPEAGRELWRAFVALSRTRTGSGVGPNPISYSEIEAWCRLFRMPLQPHHVEILVAMDQAWLRRGKVKKSAITVAAFDAVVG